LTRRSAGVRGRIDHGFAFRPRVPQDEVMGRISVATLAVAIASTVIAPIAPANAKGKLARWQTLPMPRAMPAPDAHGTVDVGGASIYYAIYGKGDPVILLHGGLGNGDHFSNSMPVLTAAHQVIVIDSRGHGRSTLGTEAITYDRMSDDVLAVMDHLQVARAAMVGWSDGGEIALDLAIHHPDRVAKMFVIGTNYDASGSKPRGVRHQTFELYAQKCRVDWQKFGHTNKEFNDLTKALLPMWRSDASFTKDQLRAIPVPSMIADGDHDEIIELAQVKEMAELIPHAQLAVFENASHFAMWQDPESFNHALIGFLDGPDVIAPKTAAAVIAP
jgi:pimeloyl-ACP methyl ester carboxylesterase